MNDCCWIRTPSLSPCQVRGPLSPGMMAVKAAAKAAGAFGCTISGAGPTAVAVTDNPETAQKVRGSEGWMLHRFVLIPETAQSLVAHQKRLDWCMGYGHERSFMASGLGSLILSPVLRKICLDLP